MHRVHVGRNVATHNDYRLRTYRATSTLVAVLPPNRVWIPTDLEGTVSCQGWGTQRLTCRMNQFEEAL